MTDIVAIAVYRRRCAQLAQEVLPAGVKQSLLADDYALWARAFGADALADICAEMAADHRGSIGTVIAESALGNAPALIGTCLLVRLYRRADEDFLRDVAGMRMADPDDLGESLASQYGVKKIVTGGSVL